MARKFSFHSEKDLTQSNEKRRLNRKLFTIVAPRYDLITRLLSFGRDRTWKKKLVNALPKKNNVTCVDLACGTGDLCVLLAERFQQGRVVGLDLTPAMLQRAQQNTTKCNIDYLQGDMMQLPIQSNSLDIITGGYALRNAPNLVNTLAMIYSTLKPGGVASFLEFSRSAKPWLGFLQMSVLTFWSNLCGLMVHGNRKVYGYIPASLKLFPHLDELKHLTESLGFIHFRSKKYLTGTITVVTFEKPIQALTHEH